MNAAVEADDGVYTIDADTEEVLDFVAGAELSAEEQPRIELPMLVAAASEGSTVVAVLDRRPPLAVSHDAGSSWREAGGGLPPGRAIAIAPGDPDRMLYAAAHRVFPPAPGDPDRMLYAAAHRVYVSRDGGRFWRALEPELPEIKRVSWLD